MAKDLNDFSNLPAPLSMDAVAVGLRGEKLVIYIQAKDTVIGFQFSIVDGFNLSYILFGATLAQLKEVGKAMTLKEGLQDLEKMLDDIDLDPDSGKDPA